MALRRLSGRLVDATLLLSRTATPLTTGRLEAGLLTAARRGVYDFDDALYADRRGGVHRLFAKPRAWSRAVAAADVVVAGNATLAQAAREYNDAVVVVPSCVEPGDYDAKDSYEVTGRPNLVWVGSPATEQYLAHLAPALSRLHAACDAVVTVVSRGDRPFPGMDHMVRRVDWSPAAAREQLARADLALAPLVDDEFTRGKCAYKLLQYGAAGVPTVGSPVGVNRTVLQDLGGSAAADLEQWFARVADVLAMAPADRAELGRRARAAVAETYSYGAWAPVFWRILFPDLPWSAPDAGAPPHRASPGDER
ncbi:glycosyltransferase [Blastococcus saxobsidens]|nr:glycosyltransferase [Blastococcus saxobsidens]